MKRWTPEDLHVLRTCWQEYTARGMTRKLKRKWSTIHNKAKILNLPMGVPQGFESVRTSMARTGYSCSGFARILRDYNVKTHSQYRPDGVTGSTKRFVDPEEVDIAVRSDMSLESLPYACAKRSITQRVMRRLVRVAGHPTVRGRPIRLAPSVYDALVRGL